MSGRFVEVIVNVPNRKVDRPFCYAVPQGMVLPLGARVMVPFNHRMVEGIVVTLDTNPANFHPKPIIARLDNNELSKELIEIAKWMADYYICPFIQALQCVLPPFAAVREEVLLKPLAALDDPAVVTLSTFDPMVGEVFNLVCNAKKTSSLNSLLGKLGTDIMPQLQDLVSRGLLEFSSVFKARKHRAPKKSLSIQGNGTEFKTLTSAQTLALQEIVLGLEHERRTMLLFGITGSGKTELYLRLAARCLGQGKGCIVLVPEIALTPQIKEVFMQHFPGLVAVLHSSMPQAERAREFERIFTGEAKIVVGARSAVFAPIFNLGLIIVDEEHEQAYKQDENPKYHVREVALKRSELSGCGVLLGSATPSLESYALALTGRYKLVAIKERIDGRTLPTVEVVDLREELLQGNRTVFSRELTEKIRDRYTKGEQVILFLNRRGFSSFIVCRECGYVAKCPHCEISLTYHLSSADLKCHYCNYSSPAPTVCPACSARGISYFGQGTQRIEQEVTTLFPGIKALRMDADSSSGSGKHQEIFQAFANGDADVLIGTQMVAKGLDFPRVTLVGVISADVTLNLPDFRSKERTFQLLTQVAGRAGRGLLAGEVVVQTFSPDDPSIIFAQNHDFEGFFHQEITFRKALGYPPFQHMLRAVLAGDNESLVARCANDLGGALRQKISQHILPEQNKIELLGPAPSVISKLKNRYRWQVILKGKNVNDLKNVMNAAVKDLYAYGSTGGIALSLDLDPLGMM